MVNNLEMNIPEMRVLETKMRSLEMKMNNRRRGLKRWRNLWRKTRGRKAMEWPSRKHPLLMRYRLLAMHPLLMKYRLLVMHPLLVKPLLAPLPQFLVPHLNLLKSTSQLSWSNLPSLVSLANLNTQFSLASLANRNTQSSPVSLTSLNSPGGVRDQPGSRRGCKLEVEAESYANAVKTRIHKVGAVVEENEGEEGM